MSQLYKNGTGELITHEKRIYKMLLDSILSRFSHVVSGSLQCRIGLPASVSSGSWLQMKNRRTHAKSRESEFSFQLATKWLACTLIL